MNKFMRKQILQKGLRDFIKRILKIKNNKDIKIKNIVINGMYHKCPHYTDFTINLKNI